jgi:hypothetical protein
VTKEFQERRQRILKRFGGLIGALPGWSLQ